ncbi:MAG: MFS transporter [Candidatus Heimdallarchaeota archaeon]
MMKNSQRTDLGILFLANSTIHMGRTYILPTILTELSSDFFLSLFQLGGIITLIQAVEAISMPISGHVSDRWSRSFSIPISLLLYGFLLSLIGILGRRSFYIFIAALTFIGILAGFYHTAAISLILDLFDERSRGKAQSIHSSGARIGSAIGPILVGVTFVARRPWTDVYLVLSIPVLGISLLLFLKRVGKSIEQSRANSNQTNNYKSPPLNFATTMLFRALFLLTAVRAIGTILIEMISFILPTYLTTQGYSQATAAFLFGWMAISGVLGVLFGGYFADRIGPLRFLMLAYAFQGVATTILVVTSGTNMIFLSAFIFGIATSTTFPAILSLLARYTSTYRRGMAYAMTGVLPATFRSIAPTIDGFLAETQSMTQIFVLGIALAFTNVTLMPLLKREEQQARSITKNQDFKR